MEDLLLRLTIWLALGLYAGSQIRPHSRTALCLATVGWLLFVAHTILAFEGHYDWSHATAYTETAIKTEALTGLGWGGGIYLNYAFGLVWLGELAWTIVSGASYRGRSRYLKWLVRGFLLFMIINGGVIFVGEPQRWIGVTIAGVMVWSWLPTGRRNTLIKSVRPGFRKTQIN